MRETSFFVSRYFLRSGVASRSLDPYAVAGGRCKGRWWDDAVGAVGAVDGMDFSRCSTARTYV